MSPSEAPPVGMRRQRRPAVQLQASLDDKLQDIIEEAKQKFSIEPREDQNAVSVALDFLDTSSLGRAAQYKEFESFCEKIELVLKRIVDENYVVYNSSIGIYESVMKSLTSSVSRLDQMKLQMKDIPMLQDSWEQRGSEIDGWRREADVASVAVLKLESLLDLHAVPAKIDDLIAKKDYCAAAAVLSEAMTAIHGENLAHVQVARSLVQQLDAARKSIVAAIVEKLCDILYLRDSISADSVSAFVQSSETDVTEVMSIPQLSTQKNSSYNDHSLLGFFMSVHTHDAYSLNEWESGLDSPAADQIKKIVNALNRLNEISAAVQTIRKRANREIAHIINSSTAEALQRLAGKGVPEHKHGIFEETNFEVVQQFPAISVFLKILFYKFKTVLQLQSVLHEKLTQILHSRSDQASTEDKSALSFDVWELCLSFQTELIVLIGDYLVGARDQSTTELNSSESSILKNTGQAAAAQDAPHELFRLNDVQTDQSITEVRKELKSQLLKIAPDAFTNEGSTHNKPGDENKPDPHSSGSWSKYSMLAKPSLSNIVVFLRPSFLFLQAMSTFLSMKSAAALRNYTPVLCAFTLGELLPVLQLECQQYIDKIFSEPFGFEPLERHPEYKEKPVARNISQMLDVVRRILQCYAEIPFEQGEFEKIAFNAVQFAERGIREKLKDIDKASRRLVRLDKYQQLRTLSKRESTTQLAIESVSDVSKAQVECVWSIATVVKFSIDQDVLGFREIDLLTRLLYSVQWLMYMFTEMSKEEINEDFNPQKPLTYLAETRYAPDSRFCEDSAILAQVFNNADSSEATNVRRMMDELCSDIAATISAQSMLIISRHMIDCVTADYRSHNIRIVPDEDILQMCDALKRLDQIFRRNLPEAYRREIEKDWPAVINELFMQRNELRQGEMSFEAARRMLMSVMSVQHSLINIYRAGKDAGNGTSKGKSAGNDDWTNFMKPAREYYEKICSGSVSADDRRAASNATSGISSNASAPATAPAGGSNIDRPGPGISSASTL